MLLQRLLQLVMIRYHKAGMVELVVFHFSAVALEPDRLLSVILVLISSSLSVVEPDLEPV